MNAVLFLIEGFPVTVGETLAAAGAACLALTLALVVAPTRELAAQIADSFRAYGQFMKPALQVGVIVGGVSARPQSEMLARGLEVLVATPGRLLDHLSTRRSALSQTEVLVLDEADHMLDLGFIHDLRKISKMVPAKRQTLLFSATMPSSIADLAATFLNNPVKVAVTAPGKAADKVEQHVHFVAGQNAKTEMLKKILVDNPDGRSIVFLRTKHGAEKLMKHLEVNGFSVASIHGNKSQGQRERALKGFRDGEIRTLIATDVAARGIDIPAVSHVFNYDLPEVPDAYVHRIGRTARAGRDGIAIAFCGPDEGRLLRDVERLMGIDIPVASGEAPSNLSRPARPQRRAGGGGAPGGNRNHQAQGRGKSDGENRGGPKADGRPGAKRKSGNGGNRNGSGKSYGQGKPPARSGTAPGGRRREA